MFSKIKNWLLGVGIAIGSFLGIHHTIPETEVIEVIPIESPAPVVVVDVPVLGPRISITCDSTCTEQEKKELPIIVQKVLEIESMPAFKKYFLENIDVGQADGLSKEEAYQMVVTSRVATELSYFYKPRNWFTKVIVVGKETGDGKVYANRAAWSYMSICEKASNVAHELSHGAPLNFSHDFNSTARRPYSIPYVIGSAVEELCK